MNGGEFDLPVILEDTGYASTSGTGGCIFNDSLITAGMLVFTHLYNTNLVRIDLKALVEGLYHVRIVTLQVQTETNSFNIIK